MPIVNYPFVDINRDGRPKPVLPIKVTNPHNGRKRKTVAQIDTGADNTVIPGWLSDYLFHELKHPKVKQGECYGIGGKKITTYKHTFRLNILRLNNKKYATDESAIRVNKRLYPVAPDLHVVILGADFLKKYVLTLNYSKKTFSLRLPKKR